MHSNAGDRSDLRAEVGDAPRGTCEHPAAMPIGLPELQSLVAAGEGPHLELKRSTGELRRGLQTLCAFLNSAGGRIVFGVGPDGTIPEPEQAMLREIGRWLAVNGEAIYGTRPFAIFGEGPTAIVEGPFGDEKRKPFTAEDVRFTTRGRTLYAVVLDWPAGGRVTIKSLAEGSPHLADAIASVSLLGTEDAVRWSRDRAGLHVELPAGRPSARAFALRIQRR